MAKLVASVLSAHAIVSSSVILRGSYTDTLSDQAEEKPLLSCGQVTSGRLSTNPWDVKLRAAYENLCKDPAIVPYMEVFLDKRFHKNYDKVYSADGWAPHAWVNYLGVSHGGDRFDQLTERLVDSLHKYSKYPVIVVNFGTVSPTELSADKFPNLVLLHARGFKPGMPLSFNFNKLRAILLAHVKVGVSVDSDMVLLNIHGDQLLKRTEQEITELYPFPMLPTHYLDRDPRDASAHKGNFLAYTCDNCPTPTLRWGQAQPSWTFWSMPFVGRWLGAKMAGGGPGQIEQGVPTNDIGEDEDLLNVALWREGASKAWCAWQTGGVNFLWENLYAEHAPGPYPWYEDARYYPNGVPVAFYFGHAEKDPAHVDKGLAYLEKPEIAKRPTPKTYFHNMTFYETFEELKKANPDVRCTM